MGHIDGRDRGRGQGIREKNLMIPEDGQPREGYGLPEGLIFVTEGLEGPRKIGTIQNKPDDALGNACRQTGCGLRCASR